MPQPQQHPEVDGANMIGWQPVFASNQSSNSRGSQMPFALIGGIAIACLIALTSIGFTFSARSDFNKQKEIWQKEAVAQEQARVIGCVNKGAR